MIKNSTLKALPFLCTAFLLHNTEVSGQMACNRVAYLSGEFNNENSTNAWNVGSGWAYNDASKKMNYFVNNSNSNSSLSQSINNVPTGSPVTVKFTYRFIEGTETNTIGDSMTVSYGGISFLNIKTTNGTAGNAVFTASNGATVITAGTLSATNDITVTLTLPAGRAAEGVLAFTAYTENYPGTETNDDLILDNIEVLGDCVSFPCNYSSTAQFTSNDFSSGGFSYNTGRFSQLDIAAGTLTPYFSNIQTDNDGTLSGISFNATGYNLLDGCIYGYVQNDPAGNVFVKVDATGAVTKFTVPHATSTGNNIGDVTPDGYYYYTGQGNSKYYCIDLNPSHTGTYLQLVDPTAGFILDTAPYGTAISANGLSDGNISIADWAYNPNDGLLYAIYSPTANNAHRLRLMKMDPLTGNVTVSSTQVNGGPPNINNETSGFGSILFGPNNHMVVFANDLGRYYQVNPVTNAATFVTASGPSNQNDGSRCALAPFVATDFSDLNSFQPGSPLYPTAYAEMKGGDVNADNIPDDVNGIWLGTMVSNDYNSDYRNFSSTNASTDTYDDGFQITGNPADAQGNPTLPLIIGHSYDFNVTAKSNSTGNAQWGMWFDTNGDGDFTDAEDIFQSGTIALTNTTPGAASFPVVTPNTPSSSGRIRFAVTRAATNTFTQAGNGTLYLNNGEIEDYYVLFTTPLPIELKSFNADKQGTNALITWTAVANNIRSFVIESSSNGKNFGSIATVTALNANGDQNYTYTDINPEPGTHYYRLKIQEQDESYSYSPVRLLNFGGNSSKVIAYPNPAKNNITVSGVEPGSEIRILGMDGRTIGSHKVSGSTIELSTTNLTPGVYLLQVIFQGRIVDKVRFSKAQF